MVVCIVHEIRETVSTKQSFLVPVHCVCVHVLVCMQLLWRR